MSHVDRRVCRKWLSQIFHLPSTFITILLTCFIIFLRSVRSHSSETIITRRSQHAETKACRRQTFLAEAFWADTQGRWHHLGSSSTRIDMPSFNAEHRPVWADVRRSRFPLFQHYLHFLAPRLMSFLPALCMWALDERCHSVSSVEMSLGTSFFFSSSRQSSLENVASGKVQADIKKSRLQ